MLANISGLREGIGQLGIECGRRTVVDFGGFIFTSSCALMPSKELLVAAMSIANGD
jgi:hypothetical protein